MIISWLYVVIGGFFGAVCRYIVGNRGKKLKTSFPAGTLTVNLVGSFLLGYLFAESVNQNMYSLFGVGFLGAFTTFSTMNVEAVQLIQQKKVSISIIYLGLTYFFGIFLALLGFILNK